MKHAVKDDFTPGQPIITRREKKKIQAEQKTLRKKIKKLTEEQKNKKLLAACLEKPKKKELVETCPEEKKIDPELFMEQDGDDEWYKLSDYNEDDDEWCQISDDQDVGNESDWMYLEIEAANETVEVLGA